MLVQVHWKKRCRKLLVNFPINYKDVATNIELNMNLEAEKWHDISCKTYSINLRFIYSFKKC